MRDLRDDRLHPTLRRARPLQQTTLDQEDAGRSAYGACTVLESTGAGGLTEFTFGGNASGKAWSLNPYTGCQHACSYCYVPDTIHAQRERWGHYAVVKRDLPTRLARSLARTPRRTVYLSTATDPYQAVEAQQRITRRCLEVLVRHDWPVEILTRSPLVLRDMDLITQFSQVRVGFSVPTLDDDVRRILEPRAPGIPARLRALRRVADAGIPTFANYTPACPPTTHDADGVARAFLDAGAQWVNSRGLQRQATILGPLWDRVHDSRWADLARFFADKERQEAWHQELGAACQRLGLPLSVPFFNPPFEALLPPKATGQRRLDEVPVPVARHTAGRGGAPRPEGRRHGVLQIRQTTPQP